MRIGYGILPEEQRLNRHHLDEIIPDKPVIIISYDFHTGWANTLSLELAGILHAVDLGLTGEIVMGEDGLAIGELREAPAFGPVLYLSEIHGGLSDVAGTAEEPLNLSQIPSHLCNLIRKGMAQASRLGITSIHNMLGDPTQLALLSAFEAEGELPLRVYYPYSIHPATPAEAIVEAIAMRDGHQGDLVRCGSVKFFIDGVIESWTALMLEDYANNPGVRGDALWEFEDFTSRVTEFDRAGFQVMVHAIGDGAIRRTLDAYEATANENGARDSRHRIEHIELLHPNDLPRFADLKVIASMQPLHAPVKEVWPALIWPECVPTERWGDAFVWQNIRDTGVPLVFGSDWPVASQDPWWGLQIALTRQSMAPGLPNQRQKLEDALASYTRDAAYAEFQEDVKGQLKVGMLADLVLLSEDLEALPIEAIKDVRPTLTVCDGVVTYEA
jgi:predicted amidohydrolase YtcJ